jgi:hypothetical protein
MSGLRYCAPALATGLALSGVLVACGGGIDGTGAVPPTSPAITSSGVMTRGSVVLNGVRFDESAASVVDDRGRAAAQLADGMVIRLRGSAVDDAGSAALIDIENEVRARIDSVEPAANPVRLVVAAQTVLIDADTVIDGGSPAALAGGVRVEVHGLRDGSGRVRASRIEILGAQQASDELRGAVSALDTGVSRFMLNGNVVVAYAGARFNPPGAGVGDLASGALVEVRGALNAGVLTATEIDVEALKDRAFAGAAGERQDVEGFVTGFAAHPGDFLVNGRAARTTTATIFEGGTAGDLANDARIEASGQVDSSGVLVLAHVEFKAPQVVLQGRATRVGTLPPQLDVLGRTVLVNDLTQVSALDAAGQPSARLADVAAGVDCVEVHALVAGPLLVADTVRELAACGSDVVQAPVSAENESTSSVTWFGSLVADLAGATVVFLDANGAPLTRAQFFDAVEPPRPGRQGTVVRASGALRGGALVGAEARLGN